MELPPLLLAASVDVSSNSCSHAMLLHMITALAIPAAKGPPPVVPLHAARYTVHIGVGERGVEGGLELPLDLRAAGSGAESALPVADSLGAQRLKHDDDTHIMAASSFCDPTPEWPRSFADEFR